MLTFLFNNESHSLILIFFILMACGLGLPVPEDITLVASGVLVAEEITTIYRAVLVCMIGVLGGDSLIYLLGRLCGPKLFKHKIISKIVRPSMYQAAAKAFNRFGDKIIFAARFMPGLRAPIFFFVGSINKSYLKFIFIDGLAAIISVPVWIYVGKIFGENLEYLETIIKKMKFGSVLLVVFFILLVILAGLFKKKVISVVTKE